MSATPWQRQAARILGVTDLRHGTPVTWHGRPYRVQSARDAGWTLRLRPADGDPSDWTDVPTVTVDITPG